MKKKDYKYLSNDIVAKYIFGTEENKEFTKRFLELYLNRKIDDIEILNSVKLISNNIKIKKLELDILVYLPKLNTKIILEVQNELNMNTLIKNVVYLLGQIVKEFKSGEKLFTKHSSIMEINLVGHICEYLKNIADTYVIKGIRKGRRLLEKLLKIVIIDLENKGVECYNGKELDMWYALMSAKSKKELEKIWELSEEYPLIRKVIVKMNEFNNVLYGNDYWLNDVLARSEYAEGFDEGETIGYQRGETIGESKRNYEIAMKMLKENEPLKKINIFTDVPVKELNKMKKSLKKVK